MKSVQEIKQNAKQSFDTLKYIFEVKLSDLIEELKFSNLDFDVSPNDGLLDCFGDLLIDIMVPEPDLTKISGSLRRVDVGLNEIFNTYFLNPDGKLVKKTGEDDIMSIGHMLYEMKYDAVEEKISLVIKFILFDL